MNKHFHMVKYSNKGSTAGAGTNSENLYEEAFKGD